MRTAKWVVALSVMLAIGGSSLAQAPLADKLPDNSIIYYGWAGRSLAFDGSMAGQLLQEPGVAQLTTGVWTMLAEATKDDPNNQAIFQSAWNLAAIAWQHPAAAAVWDIQLPDGKPGSPKQPVVSGALLVDLGKDRPAFAAALAALQAKLDKQLKFAPITSGAATYNTFVTPVGPAAFGIVGDVFFVALGDKSADTVLGLLGGKGKTLAQNVAFAAAMKDLTGPQTQLASWVDGKAIKTFMSVIARAYVTSSPASEGQKRADEFGRIVRALGLDGVTAIASATNIVERGMHQKTRIYSPAPHRGVLMPAAGKPLGKDALADIPADADFVATLSLSPADVVTELRRVLVEYDPMMATKMNEALSTVSEGLGMSIEKDLLATLGDQWTVVSAASLGGFLTGSAISVQIKDKEKFAQAQIKLEAMLAGMLARQTVGPGGAPTSAPTKAASPILVTRSGNLEIHYLRLESTAPPMPIAPAWAVSKDRLYIALWPQVVQAMIEGTAEKPLAGLPAFEAARGKLSANPNALLYVNTPRLLRLFYGAPLLGWTVVSNATAAFKLDLPPAVRQMGLRTDMWPALPKLEKYIWPDVAAVSSDANGITFESYGSLPGGGLGAMSANLVAGLLPALGQARESAKRTVSATNLSMIGKAIMMYQVDHAGVNPPDLNALVEGQFITAAASLFSPTSGRKPELRDGKLVNEPDYVYLGAKMPADADGDYVWACEKPEINNNEGANVLFVDGRVKFMKMAEFKQELKKTQDYLDGLKKK